MRDIIATLSYTLATRGHCFQLLHCGNSLHFTNLIGRFNTHTIQKSNQRTKWELS